MAEHKCITYARQDKFDVERDLRCGILEMDVADNSMKTVHLLCSRDSALIGEFVVSEDVKKEIIYDASRYLEKLCSARVSALNLMEGRMITVACVLICQKLEDESDDAHGDTLWDTILDTLCFKRIQEKTGCSRQTARNKLCTLLEDSDNIRFFTTGGKKYYNTLQLHAISPKWAIFNLFNILYSFFLKNLECCYDRDSKVAEMFISGICRRWEDKSQTEDVKLRSNQLSSSLRELFTCCPGYMAAVCDALLERIDCIVQGDFTILDPMNRWDCLLLEWYQKKAEFEKERMKQDKKAAVKRQVVDSKERIHAEYRLGNNGVEITIPGIRLPEIGERPTVELAQNGVVVYKQNLSIYGDDVLRSTRTHTIVLDKIKTIDWNRPLSFMVRIRSGEQLIYNSGSELFREYLCFSPAGNEIALKRCSQALRLIASKQDSICIDDPEDNWISEYAQYQHFRIWTESIASIQINGREILQSGNEQRRKIWAYFTPESFGDVSAKKDNVEILIYREQPQLHILLRKKEEGKNYQIIIADNVVPLYSIPSNDGEYRIDLPNTHMDTYVQVKDFETGEIVFSRKYIVIPQMRIEFDRPYYFNIGCDVCVTIYISNEVYCQKEIALDPDCDHISLPYNDTLITIQVPRFYAEMEGKNALLLPDEVWHEDMKNAFLEIRAPSGIEYYVVFEGIALKSNSFGHYEIGTAVRQLQSGGKDIILGLLVRTNNKIEERKITGICFTEHFISNPVIQNKQQILWRPNDAGYIGAADGAEFRLDLDNSAQNEPYTYSLRMKKDTIERNFDSKPGEYQYSLWLVNQKRAFVRIPDKKILEGTIVVADDPEKRYHNKSITLTHAWYEDPISRKNIWTPMQRDCAVISDILFDGYLDDEESIPCYSGILFFRTKIGWKKFSEADTDKFEKINPVYFTLPKNGYIQLSTDPDFDVDGKLMLNLKQRKQLGKIRLYSQKNELTTQEQGRYLSFAEKFQYEENEER